jgi:hypothetical protein
MARHAAKLNFAERIALNTLPTGRSGAWALFKRYEEGAAKREHEFALSFDRFVAITSQECVYCGAPPSNSYGPGRRNGRYTYNGIDRMDNARGYVEGNVAACCFFCNSAKRTLGVAEFVAWAARIQSRGEAILAGRS